MVVVLRSVMLEMSQPWKFGSWFRSFRMRLRHLLAICRGCFQGCFNWEMSGLTLRLRDRLLPLDLFWSLTWTWFVAFPFNPILSISSHHRKRSGEFSPSTSPAITSVRSQCNTSTCTVPFLTHLWPWNPVPVMTCRNAKRLVQQPCPLTWALKPGSIANKSQNLPSLNYTHSLNPWLLSQPMLPWSATHCAVQGSPPSNDHSAFQGCLPSCSTRAPSPPGRPGQLMAAIQKKSNPDNVWQWGKPNNWQALHTNLSKTPCHNPVSQQTDYTPHHFMICVPHYGTWRCTYLFIFSASSSVWAVLPTPSPLFYLLHWRSVGTNADTVGRKRSYYAWFQGLPLQTAPSPNFLRALGWPHGCASTPGPTTPTTTIPRLHLNHADFSDVSHHRYQCDENRPFTIWCKGYH